MVVGCHRQPCSAEVSSSTLANQAGDHRVGQGGQSRVPACPRLLGLGGAGLMGHVETGAELGTCCREIQWVLALLTSWDLFFFMLQALGFPWLGPSGNRATSSNDLQKAESLLGLGTG